MELQLTCIQLFFTITPQGTQDLEIQINVTQPSEDFSFGEIVLAGSMNHIVRITLSVGLLG